MLGLVKYCAPSSLIGQKNANFNLIHAYLVSQIPALVSIQVLRKTQVPPSGPQSCRQLAASFDAASGVKIKNLQSPISNDRRWSVKTWSVSQNLQTPISDDRPRSVKTKTCILQFPMTDCGLSKLATSDYPWQTAMSQEKRTYMLKFLLTDHGLSLIIGGCKFWQTFVCHWKWEDATFLT